MASQQACDLCGNIALEIIYAPKSTIRGLTVCLCTHCGLLQSLPRRDRALSEKQRRVSSEADWGNVRYGKGFRAASNLQALESHLPKNAPLEVLDVGANRGTFLLALAGKYPHARITAIEPDESVTKEWRDHDHVKLVHARLEETQLKDESFDLIYACHTLEHLRSGRAALMQLWHALKPGGLLSLEVPNTAFLAVHDVIEEFFIDKHLYHYSERTLTRLLAAAGFRVLVDPDPRDKINVSVVAQKADYGRAPIPSDTKEVDQATALIAGYQATRFKNIAALATVARLIEAMRPRGVAIWGAGRLLHSLIEQGGLKPDSVLAIVDRHLPQYAPVLHGVPLRHPETLSEVRPSVIVVMSRSFADEIRAEAKFHAPGAEILVYADLLAQARTRAA